MRRELAIWTSSKALCSHLLYRKLDLLCLTPSDFKMLFIHFKLQLFGFTKKIEFQMLLYPYGCCECVEGSWVGGVHLFFALDSPPLSTASGLTMFPRWTETESSRWNKLTCCFMLPSTTSLLPVIFLGGGAQQVGKELCYFFSWWWGACVITPK